MEPYEPNKSFDYSNVTLENPRPVQGGSYFTKITMGQNKLLYLQFPKCYTKQGIIATKRGKYCDLLYDRADETELVEWIEGFESACHALIDEKKNVWFQSELSKDDIETMMAPMCRLYKSGKKLLLRVNIDGNKHNGKDKCIVYNEREVLIDLESISDDNMIIPLVHIDGIKFSSRSFEVEIKLVQLMILDSVPEQSPLCMIKRTSNNSPMKIDVCVADNKSEFSEREQETESILEETKPILEETKPILEETKPILEETEPILEETEPILEETEPVLEETEPVLEETEPVLEETEPVLEETNNRVNQESENESENPQSLGKLEEINYLEIVGDTNELNGLNEVDLEINEDSECISLKKPNEVYYEIYRSARNKAKHMREVAVQAYLEAKELKTKYLLSDVEDSDDESIFDQ